MIMDGIVAIRAAAVAVLLTGFYTGADAETKSVLYKFSLFPSARAMDAPKKTSDVIYSFTGGSDGDRPAAGFIADGAGNLYSTAEGGGVTCYGTSSGCGTVFKIDDTGHLTGLYSFLGGSTDGAIPDGALFLDKAGDLYGTTLMGGVGACTSGPYSGCGTAFELFPNGSEQILHFFAGGNDGAEPYGALIPDGNGNLYSMTYEGGGTSCGGQGCGVVFELSPAGNGSWTETIIHTFAGSPDGGYPNGNLIFDNAGNLYGTTALGGDSTYCSGGCGTAFELSPQGNGTWSEQILYSFLGDRDGAAPGSTLVLQNNSLYGTTEQGGGSKKCTGGCGTIFELVPQPNGTWQESILHIFAGGKKGSFPGDLTPDGAGNVYGPGTEYEYGSTCGTVFKLAPGNVFTTLHKFSGFPEDGCMPIGDVFLDNHGNIYGTTFEGGANGGEYSGLGAVYKIPE